MKYASRYPMEKLMFANVYVRGKREENTIFDVYMCTFRSAQGGLLTRGLARPPASTDLQCVEIEGYFGYV